MRTKLGWAKVPNWFFKPSKLMPFFPPTDASTIAKSEVGTFTKGMPRLYVEAIKAPKSQTTPPPTLMMRLFRSAPYSKSTDHRFAAISSDLLSSPGDTSKTSNSPSNWANFGTKTERQFAVLLSTRRNVFEGANSCSKASKPS